MHLGDAQYLNNIGYFTVKNNTAHVLIRVREAKGMNTLIGAATLQNCFASLLKRGRPLKERICSQGSKFSLLRVDPFSEGV